MLIRQPGHINRRLGLHRPTIGAAHLYRLQVTPLARLAVLQPEDGSRCIWRVILADRRLHDGIGDHANIHLVVLIPRSTGEQTALDAAISLCLAGL
ncbi:hypothetical protein D3C85_1635140 [compost metagenome]